jgi:SAM-dependent methyltransferase
MADRAGGKTASDACQVDLVRTLFDSKAAGWPGKYAADGRLAGRLAQFAAAVRDLTPAGGELLDLGCGSGELAIHLAEVGHRVTGCDISPLMLDQATSADRADRVRWVGLEPGWRTLPFATGSVDAVVASSVLEYVLRPADVLAECARVLRSGGVLLCTVPSVAHPVRWLEWPLGLAARHSPWPITRDPGSRSRQYLGYLCTSRQRHRVGWWYEVGGLAGLGPSRGPGPARHWRGWRPLCLLIFTRSANVAERLVEIMGGQ